MNNPYSTHLPVLEFLFENLSINSVFEFGCGEFSTLFFAQKANKVISVEMQSEDWFWKIKQRIPDNVDLFCQLGPTDAITTLNSSELNFDLIFVDGHGDSRPECINNSFLKTNLIVTHDVETPTYNWHLVSKPKDWNYYLYNKKNPHTGIYYHESLEEIITRDRI
jgi:predicted O-methyltransferase YrrM